MARRQRGPVGVSRRRAGAAGRRPWPLRGYLAGLIALFLLAAVGGAWSGWVQADHEALSAAGSDAQHSARLAARQVGEALAVVRGTVAQFAGSPGARQVMTAAPQRCQLAFSLGTATGAGHLDVLRPNGTVACSSRPPGGGADDGYRTARWLGPAAGAAQLLAPVLDGRTGRQAVLISAPVGRVGVVAAFVDLAALGEWTGQLFAGPRQLEFLLTTGAATILTRSPAGERWAGGSTRGSRFAVAAGGGDGRDVTGLRRVYGQATVDGAGWSLYAGASRAASLAAAHRLARRQAVLAAVGLLAGLLATLLVYRRITRPIGQLRRAVRAAARGEAGGPVTVPGPREVAELGAEFGGLLAAVDRELGERRRAEETAREHERNYRQMFDTSPYPMYLCEPDSLAIIEANDAAVAYYGHSRPVLLGKRVTDLCPPEDAEAVVAAIAAAGPVERGRPQRQVKHDGTVAAVTVTSHLVSFAGRKARCAVIEDITEREHLERRLRQSERLESLGQLAGGVAHDFNNLLGIILGYAALCAADVETAGNDPACPTLHEDLLQIVSAGNKATALTRQLLAFARADAVAEPRVLDLNAVVADIHKLLARTLGEDVALLLRLADQPCMVRADPGRLEQVLMNLAVNARDAMPAGGTLTIETEPLTVDEHYAAGHPGVQPGRHIRLQVSDTGSGMSQATLERAFEPFFTTKPTGHGTGLGLATIYGIITQAGGQARIYSEPGHGTTVTALLPATDEASGTAAAPPAAPDPGNGQTILLVEDDANLRALTERILTRHGYTVLAATTPAEALHLVTAHRGIELLLTDVVMPGMDGHTLATAIHELRPTVAVIYMSGYTQTVLAARSTLPAGTTLLNKPVTAHHLLTAVAGGLTGGRRPAAATRPGRMP
jgi:PAS domain S-box-containing protein